MPATADFFQAGPRNWRARLAISVDLMRELVNRKYTTLAAGVATGLIIVINAVLVARVV